MKSFIQLTPTMIAGSMFAAADEAAACTKEANETGNPWARDEARVQAGVAAIFQSNLRMMADDESTRYIVCVPHVEDDGTYEFSKEDCPCGMQVLDTYYDFDAACAHAKHETREHGLAALVFEIHTAYVSMPDDAAEG